jgi:nucleoid-associated protein YgaU
MPVRGLIVVVALVVAAAAGWYLLSHKELLQLNGDTLTRDIIRTPGPGEAPKAEAGPILPSFDVVRVEPTGEAVVAGRAAPGASVDILVNGAVVAKAKAGPDGSWAVTLDKPLAAGSQELTLTATDADGATRKSTQSVVVDVPQTGHARPLVVLDSPGAASRVLQRPDDLKAGVIAVESVDYDDHGDVILSGHAPARATLRLYLDNAPIGDAAADAKGDWSLRPKNIKPGDYTLRVDQIDSKGKVVARIEVPFERADPESAAKAMLGGGQVVVQPGNSLWRIARRVYGSGFQFTVIYQANAEQIRDPNLIYPGQVFELPKVAPPG